MATPALRAELADRAERPVQVRSDFGVDRHHRRAGPDERLEVAIRVRRSSGARRAARASTRFNAATTGGPIVRLGTKWPSMTST